MSWNNFLFFAIPSVLFWLTGGIAVHTKTRSIFIDILTIVGILVFASFIIGLWIGLKHPPLQTMGETRLWYSFFLVTVGFIAYKRWKYKWFLTYSSIVATVFVSVNIFKPEIHSKNLMPALQSIWFIPHVTVYILSYAMFGAATIASLVQLYKFDKGKIDTELYRFIDNLVYSGFGFLMLGMLMGCVWAKEAWGDYWTWDPKETWAFVTAAAYLVYIHARKKNTHQAFTLWMLPVAFVLLMITWLGVNCLPSAQSSIHAY